MRVPLSILRNFVALSPRGEAELLDVARTLNGRVSEVEAIHRGPARASLDAVRFARMEAPLERANAHTRWSTDLGAAIVVADKYGVGSGERYAAILAGGALPDGVLVAARSVAGLPSEGMLVSEAQLGLGDEAARPFRVADDAAGHAFDALGADDAVLEFDLEPNRPDLFALAGMARDASAIWGLAYGEPARADLSGLPPLDSPRIEIRTPRAHRYEAVLLRGVRIGPSPQWLQNAVRKLGMRSINNVVDAANLVMLETGQPLHTFDAAALTGGAIVLRMAENEERITTLDGVERVLTDECLLVCDGERPVAIAGVMGDARSEVTDVTRDVLIEGAAFDMAAVRRASRRLSLRTEASTRFEKGLPLSGIRPAIERLVYLLASLSGAVPVAASCAGSAPPAPVSIPLDRAAILERLGMKLSNDRIDAILRGLGFTVLADAVLIPESRPDVRIPQDLVEEIGRIHGYEAVISEAPSLRLASPTSNPVVEASRRVRRVLTAHGWDEVYLPVWIGDAEVDRFGLDRNTLIALLNPIADNLRYFRPTAWPALCEAAVQNRKECDRFAIFEVGKVYRRRDADSPEGPAGTIDERAHLAGIAMGADLFDLRDALSALASAQGADAAVTRPQHPHLHPGRSFALGTHTIAGELHPGLVRALGFREAPLVFATDLSAVAAGRPAAIRYLAPSRFPTVELDLNVEVPPRVEAGAVVAAVPAVPWLREACCADVYGLPSGARLTLAFRFGAADRSLALEEATASLDLVRAAMREHGWSPA